MSKTDPDGELVLRPSLPVRAAAGVVALCGVGLPFAFDQVVVGILIGACFVGAGFTAMRIAVRVGPDGVRLSGGLRSEQLPWGQIEGFRFDNGSNGGVFVLGVDGEMKRLPWDGQLTVFGKKSRKADLCARLEGLRETFQERST